MPLPADDRRFLVLCMVGAFILGIALALIGLVVWVDAHPAPGVESASKVSPLLLIGAITVFAGGALTQVWGMIKQEQNNRRSEQFRAETTGALADIKTTAEVTTLHAHAAQQTAETVANEVKQAISTLIRQTNGELDQKIVSAVSVAIEKKVPEAVAAAMQDTCSKIEDINSEMHKIKHSMANLSAVDTLAKAAGKLDEKKG